MQPYIGTGGVGNRGEVAPEPVEFNEACISIAQQLNYVIKHGRTRRTYET